ncbi:serine/threonine-protein kinase [Actinophytocola sp.]|uniref:serine/threonine-protein kinase n=1 Tax=Actinophytocola sp. TaxID=1872138 RepID=UPI002ECFB6E1
MRSDDVIADRYRLVELVGSGGMGIVWLADDLRSNRQVALKRPHVTAPGVRSGLEREAEIAQRVVHPGVVKVFGVAGDTDDCWLVMEYFPGDSLAGQRLAPPREVAAIGAQVAGALAAAHAADVVHRDVTPGNIMVDADGVVKVTDFGISAWRAATITISGKVSGTPAYVSPEVANGNAATASSDVFSLGATLFALVEGEPPFGTGDADAVLSRVRTGRVDIAARAGALRPVLDALLQRDPDARPTAAQAKGMLEKVASGQSVPCWPGVRSRPSVVLVAAAVIAVVAVLVLGLVRPWESETAGPVRTALGDPRSADPCSVADADVLGRFGEAKMDPNYGGLNRCDVLIAVAGDDEIDVVFEFGEAVTEAPTSEPSTVTRHAPERNDDGCDIALTLADQAVLEVVAKSYDDVDTDFCQVADVAADHAESVLSQHEQVPRRPPLDPRSLANVDACGLLGAADLAAVPAYAGVTPQPGFADWSCRWQSPRGALRVIFDRNDLEDAARGTELALSGRDVHVEPEGYGDFTCAAKVSHLRYQDDFGDTRTELALVVAEGGVAMTELCGVVRTFAVPIAARLPQL